MAVLDYFPCYNSYYSKTAKLSDKEVGRLFRALMIYNATGERQEFDGREELAFDFIADDIDRAKEKYSAKCETNKNNRQQSSTTVNDRQQSSTTVNDRGQYKDKNKDKNKDKYFEEPSLHSGSSCGAPCHDAPPVIVFPLISGDEYGITEEQLAKWTSLYPAVDVMQELRNMAGWLDGNPANRKTRKGVPRFVNSWLSKAQNSAGRVKRSGGNPFAELLAEGAFDDE